MIEKFQYISIRRRLILILALCIVLFISFGIYVLQLMKNIGSTTTYIYEQPFLVSNASVDARLSIIKIQRDMRNLMLPSSKEELDKNVEDISVLDDRIIKDLETIKEHFTVSQSEDLQTQVRESYIIWKSNREGIIEFIKEDNFQAASKELKGTNDDLVVKMEKYFQQIEDNSSIKANDLVVQSKLVQREQRVYLYFGVVFLCMLFLCIFITVIKSILIPLNKLKEAMDEGISTGKLKEVSLDGNNEIRELSEYYNTLTRRLINLFWIKDSRNILEKEIYVNRSLDDFAQKTINYICRNVSAGKGAFYILNKKTNILGLKAAFAALVSSKPISAFSLGEGIVGQVALDKKPILVEVPGEDSGNIASAFINIRPQHSYIMPLVYKHELYGVIEIASINKFTEVDLEYLKDACETISINLFTAIQKDKIEGLLKVSEEARKEASKTAEELSKANASLSIQQQMLQQQASELQQSNAELEEQQQMLQQQSEELEQSNLQLEEQQKQLEEQSILLSRQNAQLKENSRNLELSSKYKTEFLANMSHELRTPLNSIILLSKLLKDRGRDRLSQEDLEKIGVINSSGQELLRLINDVLDLSKIEAGYISSEKCIFSSDILTKELEGIFKAIVMEKGLAFNITDNIKGSLIGDERKISQILRNFISNAIKFTEKGYINISFEEEEDNLAGVKFIVKDSGIGIPKDQLNTIFEEFKQGDGSISRKYGGTGLGLSISKKLAQHMKGTITVISEIGKGSEFTLFIPNLVQKSKNKGDSYIYVDKTSDEAAVSLEEKQQTDGEGDKNILIIEDDISFANYVKEIVLGMGFEAIISESGIYGLRLAKELKPKGILLDLGLPDMDGIEVLRELKGIRELRDVPVHIISVHDKNNRAQRIGAVGYKQKPVNEGDIVDIVSHMIKLSENKQRKVLLIEQDEVKERQIRKLILDKETEIITARTEEEAKAVIKDKSCDTIVLDMNFEKRMGLNICRFISENKIDTPVVIYLETALTLQQEKEIRGIADSIILKTAVSQEALMDEVTLFLHKVKKSNALKEEAALKIEEAEILSLKDKNILIADDDVRNIFSLASVLENYNANVIDAGSGRVALEKLKQHKVDLVLMDIMMPEMDGYETIRYIREDASLSTLPIIAVTAKSLREEKEKCIKAGANDYISKPVDYDNLIRVIKAWIYKAE